LRKNYINDKAALANRTGYCARMSNLQYKYAVSGDVDARTALFYNIIEYLISRPAGATRNEIREALCTSEDKRKNFSKWLKRMFQRNLTEIEIKNGEELLRYNVKNLEKYSIGDILRYENNRLKNALAKESSQQSQRIQQPESSNTQNENQVNTSFNATSEEEPLKLNKSDINSLVKKAKSIIVFNDGGIERKKLQGFLRVSDELFEQVFSKLKLSNLKSITSAPDKDGNEIVKYDEANADDKTNKVGFSKIKKRIEKFKTVLLSDLMKLELIPAELKKDEIETILNELEDMGFMVIEICSKYIEPEFIVHLDGATEEQLKDAVKHTKKRVGEHFREKLFVHFYDSVALRHYDNGYESSFKTQLELFYNYIVKMMDKYGGRVYLETSILYEMDFKTYSALVSLHHANLIVELAKEMAKSKKTLPELREQLRIEGPLTTEKIAGLREAIGQATLGEVFASIAESKALTSYLNQRVSIHMLDKLFCGVAKYNLFEVFVDEGYFYFSVIPNVDSYLEKVLCMVENAEKDDAKARILELAKAREDYFGKICELSQEEFLENAEKILAQSAYPSKIKSSFKRKLDMFK
ncbi:hypothetical protein ENBRE01_3357, partial [Enteropsectra breve]